MVEVASKFYGYHYFTQPPLDDPVERHVNVVSGDRWS